MELSSAGKQFLKKRFLSLRVVAASIYPIVVRLELDDQRNFDSIVTPLQVSGRDAPRELTALIKTLERPNVLRRLLASIERFYSKLAIIVVDDSREPCRFPGVDTVVLPYHSGVSAVRREGLSRVTTRYFLLRTMTSSFSVTRSWNRHWSSWIDSRRSIS